MRLLNEGLSVSSSHSVGIVGVNAFLEIHQAVWTVSTCLEQHGSSSRGSIQTCKFYVLVF